MKSQENRLIDKNKKGKYLAVLCVAAGMFFSLFIIGGMEVDSSESGQTMRKNTRDTGSKTIAYAGTTNKNDDGLWDGPVLYHEAGSKPIHLILIEKSTQTLYLYRYDGKYHRVKNYFCASGEKQGKKREEKDEKTPEGIYFNNKTYRDRKVTVFGDRAFGLNYPDIFDNLTGNKGSGIFLHGSNRKVTSYSSNGCLVLNNADIADLDKRVDIKQTPVIIGERLPYRFGAVKRDLSELVPFLKQTLLPEKYAGMTADVDDLTVLGFEDRVVATARVGVKANQAVYGRSRLYLAGPGKTLLVLVKREWNEEKREVIVAKKATSEKVPAKAASNVPTGEKKRLFERVESWRRAWEGKRLNEYIGHYHPRFTSKGKNLSQWKAYKGKLNERNRKISVKVSGVRVKIDGQQARAYFRQHYRSDTYRSSSYKILEFRMKGNKWKIYRENSSVGKPSGWPI